MSVGKVETDIIIRDDGSAAAIDRTINGLGKVADAGKKATGGLAGLLKGLKGSLGEDSALGGTMKLLQGAGAVAVVGLIARGIETAATNAKKLGDEFRAGKIAAEDIGPAVVGLIPVLGSVQRAAIAVWQAFSGDIDLSKQIDDQSKLARELEKQVRLLKAGDEAERSRIAATDTYRETLSKIAALQKEAAGPNNENVAAATRMADQMRADAKRVLDDAMGAAERASQAETKKSIDALREQLAVLRDGEEAVKLKALATGGATAAQVQEAAALLNGIQAAKDKATADQEAASKAKSNADSITQTVRALQEQVITLADGADAVTRYTLMQLGASSETLQHVEALQREAAALNERNDMMTRAADVYKQTRTPVEQYKASLVELTKMLRDGAITEDTFQRAKDAANKKLADEEKKNAKTEQPGGGSIVGLADLWKQIAAASAKPPAERAAEDTARNTAEVAGQTREVASATSQTAATLARIESKMTGGAVWA